MTDNEEIRELRRSTTKHPDVGVETSDTSALEEEIAAALAAIEADEASKMVGFRDQTIAALLIAAETRDEDRRTLGNKLARAAGQDTQESFTRSELVRLAVRVGLQQAAPEEYECLTAAKIQHARETL